MAKVGNKQPSEIFTYDIDLSNGLKRSDHTITSIIGFVDDQDVSLTYSDPLVIGNKEIRVTMAGGVDGTSYKVTVKVVTNYDPIAEVDFYMVIAEI